MDALWVCWIAAAARLRARRWQKSVIPIENDHCIRWILESRIFNAFPRFFDSQGEKKMQRLPVSFFEGLKVFLFFHVQSSKDCLFFVGLLVASQPFHPVFCYVLSIQKQHVHYKKKTNKRRNALQKVLFSQLWCGHLNHHAQWLLEKKWPFSAVRSLAVEVTHGVP